MKKIICVLVAVFLLLSAGSCIVSAAQTPQKLTLERTELKLGIGEKKKFKFECDSPEDVVITSNDENIVSVKDGYLYAEKIGEAVITASYKDEEQKCNVTVLNSPDKITPNKTEITLCEGETRKVSFSFPEGTYSYKKIYSSDNEEIATICDGGIITGIHEGSCEAKISTYNDKSTTIKVNVVKAPKKITISQKSISLRVGQKEKLLFSFDSEIDSQSYSLSCSNSVCTVNSSGVITAKKSGTAKITVSAFGGIKAAISVTVNPAPKKAELNLSSVTLGKGESVTIKPSFDTKLNKDEYTFSSSDKNVCNVSNDGKITAKATGKATVTVKAYNGIKATCKVTIKKAPSSISFSMSKITLGKGESIKLKYSLSTDSASYKKTFSKSGSSVTLDKNGTVKAVKTGSTTVKLTTFNGKTASVKIEVLKAPTSISCANYTLRQGKKIVPEIDFKKGEFSSIIKLTSSNKNVCSITSDGKMWAKKIGEAKITATTFNGKKTTFTLKVKRMNVPFVSQTDAGYPTGCEAASCSALLKYYGYNVSVGTMVKNIPRENVVTKNGKRYGPDINEKFVGNPAHGYTSSSPGYGAFSPCITKSLNKVLKKLNSKYTAKKVSGCSFSELQQYVSDGHAAIVWATYKMRTPQTVNSWYIPNGDGTYRYFSYPRGTHVFVLEGVSGSSIYLMDPILGHVSYSKDSFESKWKLLGKQMIILEK